MVHSSKSIALGAVAALSLIASGIGIGFWLRPGAPPPAAPSAPPPQRVLYYKNPMGLADTSPVPKKDSMGMDYIPVYASGGGNEAGLVVVDPARVQMLGVKTASVARRASLTRQVRATGTIRADESRLASVTTKFDGVVEKLFVATTGAPVRAGEPLARVWIQTPDTNMQLGPDVITREIDLIVALEDKNETAITQAEAVLRQYGIPDSTIADIRRTGRASRFVTLIAPRSGIVLEKPAIEGMHFNTGDPLFKIADLSSVWLIADVPEQDLGALKLGEAAAATLVAYPGQSFAGKVDFIYPTLNPNTRTGQARIVFANKDGLLRQDMYANVTIDAPTAPGREMTVVPDSAILNNGAQSLVLVAHGQGRFEPRAVKTGREGGGYTEIVQGVTVGENVVTDASFLIDAESNLRAALSGFMAGETGAAP